MVTYKVTFRTGTAEYAGTDSSVYCTLIGEEGESLKTSVGEWLQMDLERGAVDRYEISSDQDLGTIWFVQLEVTRFLLPDSWFLMQDYWYCCSVTVETPSGKTFYFPCYKWLDNCTIRLREGTAQRVCDDQLPIFQSHRQDELRERQQLYRWKVFHPNMPRCIDAESLDDLPMDLRFSSEKERNFKFSMAKALQVQQLKKFVNKFGQSWTTVEDFDHIFWKVNSSIAAFVRQHWKEDWFFGYQFLNGFNPVLIQKCEKIPANFPVTNAMVKKSLRNAKLEQEMKNGNIFIVNYKMLDGIPANVINGVQQYMAAPICLLYLNKENHIMPIAIQLNQTPGKDNPIFLPSDADLDWLLAKMWVRSADILHFEMVSHLLKTHIIAEPFCVATIRQLPSMHPIYKLLIPHVRYTMQINLQSRLRLIGRDGAFSKAFGLGAEGQLMLFSNEFQAMTYQSLCLPENLENRGVKELKDYYYKDDGLLIWSAIHKFVTKIVMIYYDNDQQVMDDTELQAWIKDVTEVGFQDLKNSGIPTSFCRRMELCKFLTMVIFTCSAQHAAVNSGQYDWSAWVPNSPPSMRKPPPKAKGMVIMEHVMESLPDIAQSCTQMALSWVLTRSQPGMDVGVAAQASIYCPFLIALEKVVVTCLELLQSLRCRKILGDYEEYFSEKAVKDIIKEFQEELKTIDRKIQERNEGLDLKYEYLRPVNIENSITI